MKIPTAISLALCALLLTACSDDEICVAVQVDDTLKETSQAPCFPEDGRNGLWELRTSKKGGAKLNRERGLYVNGKRQGEWVDNFGSYVHRGHYVDGKKHGEWVEDGWYSISRGEYVNGERHGEWMEVHTHDGDMERGTYVNGKKHGEWEEHESLLGSGRIERGPYVDDERHGKWELIFDNGVTVNRCFAHGQKVACDTNSNP